MFDFSQLMALYGVGFGAMSIGLGIAFLAVFERREDGLRAEIAVLNRRITDLNMRISQQDAQIAILIRRERETFPNEFAPAP